MKIKKRYLLLSVFGTALLLCSNPAIAMGEEEMAKLQCIEKDRHDKNKSEEICNNLSGYIQSDGFSQDFRVYCLSIAVKIMENDQLQELLKNLPADLNYLSNANNCYFNLFYRCINKKEDLSSYDDIRNFISLIINSGTKFLSEEGLKRENFREYDGIKKLYILKSLCALATCREENMTQELKGQLSKMEFSDLTSNNKSLQTKIWLTYAKIPGKAEEQIQALNAIFGETPFETIAATEQGRDALLAYAKIPGEHQKTEGIEALNAIFGERQFETIAKTEQGRDALITYAKIPGRAEDQIQALNAIFGETPFETIAKTEQGRDALITYARIPGKAEDQIQALNAIFGGRQFETIAATEQGRDALITYARIPANDTAKRIQALNAIFGETPFETIAKTEQGRDALLTYARIPGKAEEQIQALNAIFGGRQFETIAATEQGRDALLAYAKIPGEHQKAEGIQALNAIFGERQFETIAATEQGRDALLTYAKIPGKAEDQILALEALKSAAPSNRQISITANNIMQHAKGLTAEDMARLSKLNATPNYAKGGQNASMRPMYNFRKGTRH